MNSITDWMLSEKLATHWKQAQNIIKGLKLDELYNAKRFDEIKARTRLYRSWRNAGESSATAYENAIAGKPTPAEMFQSVPERGGGVSYYPKKLVDASIKTNALKIHASIRAKERLLFHVDMDEIARMIKKHKSTFVEKLSNRKAVHMIRKNGIEFYVIYDKSRGVVVTVLPMDSQ